MNIKRFETYPRLSSALTVTFVLCGILVVLLLLSRVSHHVVRLEKEIKDELLISGIQGVRSTLNRSIEREWRSLGAMAKSAKLSNLEELQHSVDTAAHVGASVAWAGFADLNGVIVAGSRRRGEGKDVSGRSWFRESLTTGTLTSTKSHPAATNESFLQLTRPVVDENNEVVGILMFRLSMSWGRQLIAEAAERSAVQVVLLSPDRTVIADVRTDPTQPVPAISFGLTEPGVQVLRLETGSKHSDELVLCTVQAFTSEKLPYFGARLIAFAPSAIAEASIDSFSKHLFYWIAASLTIATLIPIVLVAHFIRPIERLAKTAQLLADGQFEFPEERCFTREAAILSTSLARIQTRLQRQEISENSGDPTHQTPLISHEMRPLRTPLMRRKSTRVA